MRSRLTPLLFLALASVLLTLAACGRSDVPPATPVQNVSAADAPGTAHVAAATPEAAGRYLIIAGNCNDCHTPNFMERGMDVPESEWLTGSPIGFRGPWGTSYPKNLRLTAQSLSEDVWVQTLRTRTSLPPMPWMNVNELSEADARALYRYIRSLGPAGVPAPLPVPPGEEPATPYFDFVPQHLERMPAPPGAAATAPDSAAAAGGAPAAAAP